jgi:hypothetical protein
LGAHFLRPGSCNLPKLVADRLGGDGLSSCRLGGGVRSADEPRQLAGAQSHRREDRRVDVRPALIFVFILAWAGRRDWLDLAAARGERRREAVALRLRELADRPPGPAAARRILAARRRTGFSGVVARRVAGRETGRVTVLTMAPSVPPMTAPTGPPTTAPTTAPVAPATKRFEPGLNLDARAARDAAVGDLGSVMGGPVSRFFRDLVEAPSRALVVDLFMAISLAQSMPWIESTKAGPVTPVRSEHSARGLRAECLRVL